MSQNRSKESREKAKASGWLPIDKQEAFPEHIREWARQLWTYRCARDVNRVVAYMAAGEHDGNNEVFPPTKVSARTIREWSKRDKWVEQALKENKALHADLFNTVAAQNVHNSADAVRVQAEMLYMVKDDLERKAAWTPEYDEQGKVINPMPEMRLDPREIKAVTDLTNGILDRAGHTAWSRKEVGEAPTGPSVSHADAIGGKDLAELMELSRMKILELNSGSKEGAPVGGGKLSTVEDDESGIIEVETHAPKRSAN